MNDTTTETATMRAVVQDHYGSADVLEVRNSCTTDGRVR